MSATAAPVLPATLRLGAVHLTVTSLDRSVAWYQRHLGLRVHRRDSIEAELGDGAEATVVLVEDPQARPAGRHAGLFHYALLFPTREELARAAARLSAAQTRLQGASDHGTHEAIYLADPDGNGIELAADRPRDEWVPLQVELDRGGPLPLDFPSLLASVEGEAPAEQVGAGLRMGHLHLHVGDVEEGLAFYRDLVGFELQAAMATVAFVSAGGYHHHLAFNTWRGRGVGPPPDRTVGLRHWTVRLDTREQVDEVSARLRAAGVPVHADGDGFLVRDPWAAGLRFEVA